jgi:hypothetical protein
MNRNRRYLLSCVRIAAGLAAALAPLALPAQQWTVERVGIDLYRISGRSTFIRTEGCGDGPSAGTANYQKGSDTGFLTFSGPAAKCRVRDFLVPAKLETGRFNVRLTMDQTANWYQVTDGDLYLKTLGCISRTLSELAVLDLYPDGSGQIRLEDGKICRVEHAYKRMNP